VKLPALAVATCLASLATGCIWTEGSVTRIYAGKTKEERFIVPEAYAHYTEAQLLETSGDDAAAEQEYLQAVDLDPDSVDIWTRLGAVRCRLESDFDAAFGNAESLDRDYAPLWRERSICALSRNDSQHAIEWGKRAIALDPDDARSSLAVTRALEKAGQIQEAARWKLALQLRDPGGPSFEAAVQNLIQKGKRPARSKASISTRPGRKDVDHALLHDSPKRARELALKSGVPVSELAMRAAALGLTEIAATESRRVLDADPDDSDAWIAALVAADLAHDEERFLTATGLLGSEPLAPGPLGRRLLVELLARRISIEAARSFLDQSPLPAPRDDLETRVDARLRTLGLVR
jgi:tetratricopeptide (TPR) repeat protein